MKLFALVATMSLSFQAFAAVNTTYFPSLDVKAIHDKEVANEKKGEAPRFAVPHSVSVSPSESQDWEKSAQGYTWTHRVTTPNAVSLNFGFSRFNLPEGAELNIYSADRTQFIRAFTSADNNVNNQLWTPVIMSDDVIIELSVPAHAVNDVQLELTQVGQGFRTFAQSTLKSGSCNIDVACSESKGWEDEVNSVGVISTGGSSFCTGFMVNNTNNDKTPFFMTAAHCRITASTAPSLVVYWNYQASKCGGSRDGSMTQFQSGSVHLASNAKSDATLVKMNTAPKPEWNVNFAGWDATAAIGTSAVAIHHPNVDEKSISFENDPTALSSYGGTSSPGDSTHVWVKDWDKGTTEPGSSGSPLFDSNHRVIGQLHGGGAACGNDLPDYYGRFHTTYKEANLKKFLDSANTGKMTVDTI
ncbi:MAG: trypsin-like peptidase domain-containing protein [Bdellovibrionales bacterium]|nr:trypsin-like peptidase domain-containing protein [Bdellovibrionales bacterium]